MHVPCPEAGFDVTDGDLVVEGGDSGSEDGGGIALDEDGIGFLLDAPLGHGGDDAASEVSEGLAWLHEVEIELGMDPEDGQGLVEHLPMLGGGQEDGGK